MTNRLPQVLGRTSRGDDGCDIELLVQPELLWFGGHFPGTPILPGVVQIHWALHFARECLGMALPAARDFQVKFKATIVPGDRLVLALDRNSARGHLTFEFRRDGQVCSGGRVKLA